MNILILEADQNIGRIWSNHLKRQGFLCELALTKDDAIHHIQSQNVGVLVINMKEFSSSSLVITDLATYRNPNLAIIGVSSRNFFSAASIFKLIPNLRTVVENPIDPDDLTAMVEHYGRPPSFSREYIN